MKPKTLVSLLSIRMDENVSSGENQIISSVSFAGSWGWRKPTVMMSLSTIYLAFYNSAYRSTGDYENTVIVSYTQSGHINLLKYLKSEGMSFDSDACLLAAEGGHIDVLK